jgi:uncharacterized membrane protein
VSTLNWHGLPQHPAVLAQLEARQKNLQIRLADVITAFAGSMQFVYIHAVVFAVWMIFLEKDPWPKLTLVVSLEAIFLSTFVMIGQNRAAVFQQAKANHDFVEQEQELKTNTAAEAGGFGGALWGTLLGLLFLNPLAGLVRETSV